MVIGFIFLVKKSLINQESLFEKKIFGTWSIIFLVVFFDIIFEIIFGFNIFGFTSYYPGRIASFFNDELVAGGFFLGFSLFTLSYFLNFFSQYKKTIIIYVLILILVSFLIGERANFIKFLLGISIFILITQRKKWKTYVIGFFGLFLLLSVIIDSSNNYNNRYIVQVKQIFKKNGISNYLKESQYGAHYNSAYQIFKNYPIFGIGIKNFRKEVIKNEYENKDYKKTTSRWGTHPHQVHFEFLSETGLFGYIIFLFFIFSSIYLSCKNYIKHKNNFQLSGILFVTLSIIPLIPSGSFFSTFPSGLFWINYAIMVSYIKE
jgi:O-antigen ligase